MISDIARFLMSFKKLIGFIYDQIWNNLSQSDLARRYTECRKLLYSFLDSLVELDDVQNRKLLGKLNLHHLVELVEIHEFELRRVKLT